MFLACTEFEKQHHGTLLRVIHPLADFHRVFIRQAEIPVEQPHQIIDGNAVVVDLDDDGKGWAEIEATHAILHRNAEGGGTTGPLEVDKAWDAFTDDQLALMDHLGIDQFRVLGFCIAGPMIWNLLKRAGDRVISAVLTHPSGYTSAFPDIYMRNALAGWAPTFLEQRPDITLEQVEAFLDAMYTQRADFVFTVDRDFVRNCQTPILVLPDDIPAHPYATAMETALLAPNAEVSLYPWKENSRKIELARRHIRSFLKVNSA